MKTIFAYDGPDIDFFSRYWYYYFNDCVKEQNGIAHELFCMKDLMLDWL